MTIIKVHKKNGAVARLICHGHTGFADEGEDIVCASVSSIVQTAVLGIFQVAGVNAELSRDREEGLLKLVMPQKMEANELHDSNIIFETMLCGLTDLHSEFGKYFKLEVIESCS